MGYRGSMSEAEARWVGGAFSAFGVASARGRGKQPSLMLMAFTEEVPELIVEMTQLGRVEGSVKWRWVCDDPIQVMAFYQDVGPFLVPSRRKMIERAWTNYRVWSQEKQSEDPGPLLDEGDDGEGL